ncbi:MAG: V-type ATP synthase subunit F [Methanocellales archaeon]|nr:V-type ATP synthase subunit F [Methanocellales archaeon]MDD4898153.1 V-type ATP synthase subunit F [Methanocellales archaeon]
MYKIGIIGDKDEILCFKALGVVTYGAKDVEEASSMLSKACDENFGIIFISEGFAKNLDEQISGIEMPIIIEIPDKKGITGFGIEKLRRTVEKAVGTNILSKKGD